MSENRTKLWNRRNIKKVIDREVTPKARVEAGEVESKAVELMQDVNLENGAR